MVLRFDDIVSEEKESIEQGECPKEVRTVTNGSEFISSTSEVERRMPKHVVLFECRSRPVEATALCLLSIA